MLNSITNEEVLPSASHDHNTMLADGEFVLSDVQNVRPYRYRQIEEFTLILCQKMGWFTDVSVRQITEEMKTTPHWKNNWQYACASYDYWRTEFE